MTLTMTISIPSAIFFTNWLGTLWRGSIRFDSPMLFAMGVVFVFGLGGLTGLYLGTVTTDIYLHDTYFVVGHFHYTMAASVLLGGFAAIYFWMPKMFGVMMNECLAKWHFWLSFIGLNGIFMGMMVLGYAGMHRRLYNPFVYDFMKGMIPLNNLVTWAAILMGAAQLIFILNFFGSMLYGRRPRRNPWRANTLEWLAPSPPPHGNFDFQPIVERGPYEYSHPDRDEDYWPQSDVNSETAINT